MQFCDLYKLFLQFYNWFQEHAHIVKIIKSLIRLRSRKSEII